MRVSETLVDDLYFQFLVRRNFQEGLGLLCEVFEAHGGGIINISKGGTVLLTSRGINLESVANYHGDSNKDDYLVPFIKANNSDKTFSASSVIHLPDIQKSDYYQAVDKPSDIYDKMAYHIVTPSAEFAIALYRDLKRQYTKSDLEVARKLQPHIARCFRLLQLKSDSFHNLVQSKELTEREVEISTLISMGNDYAKIAATLKMSQNTLKWHMKNIFQKFEVRSLTELSIMLREAFSK